MSYTRAQKSSSWTPPAQAKSSHWAPPPMTVQTKPASASSDTQEMPSYKPLPADWATNNPIMRSLQRESSQAEGEVLQSDSAVEGNVQMSAEHGTIQRQCEKCESELSAQEEKPPVQTKLTVGAPGDPYEQEADRVAAQVMSMSDAPDNSPQVQRFGEEDNAVQKSSLAQSITPVVQRQVNEWVQLREWAQQALQASGTQASGDLESRLNASKGGGSPLAPEVRTFMEPRFGADFSSVRVHTGSEAVQLNQELGAQAFAHGSDIYFGAGKSAGNNELTAHELTHVVQQGGAGLKHKPRLGQSNSSSVLRHLQTMQQQPGFDTSLQAPPDGCVTGNLSVRTSGSLQGGWSVNDYLSGGSSWGAVGSPTTAGSDGRGFKAQIVGSFSGAENL